MPDCYLLRSQPSPTISYVGFTVDPVQRLQRHHSAHGAKANQEEPPVGVRGGGVWLCKQHSSKVL